jgi:hypothetical protein
MNFIDTVAALLILGIFFSGASGVFLPVYKAYKDVSAQYSGAKSIHFIAESFKDECAKPDRNMENWKKAVAAVKELESCEISEITKAGKTLALKASCVIQGEHVEINALCGPGKQAVP